MPEPRVLATGLGIPESPRWHEGRLWFSNWGLQEVVAVDLAGRTEVVVRVPRDLPFRIDWLPDGRLLVVSGPEGRLLRREPHRTLVTHADLGARTPWTVATSFPASPARSVRSSRAISDPISPRRQRHGKEA